MEGIYNFRDFGGYAAGEGARIKTGLLFRSGSLADASDADVRALAALRLRTVCDLRTHRERSDQPDRLPDDGTIRATHIPIKVKRHKENSRLAQMADLLFAGARRPDNDEATRATYQEYVADFRAEFSAILKLVADPSNLPILIHCTGGKDRTGFACGLIQLALGVPLELVMQEYLLSNDHLQGYKEAMLKRLAIFSLFGVTREELLPLFEARPGYLQAALDRIQEDYGSLDDYLRDGLSLSEDDKRHLHAALLE